MKLSPADLDDWRAWLDAAPPKMRAIVLGLMARTADLKERNRRQRALLDAERLHLVEQDRLIDAIGGVRTREV